MRRQGGRPRKLTPEQVTQLREVYELRRNIPTLPQLAKEWGVTKGAVYQIAIGRSYKVER